ncbi:MAG: M16 family metallopeptidase [Tepidisphaeraceae bacterium]
MRRKFASLLTVGLIASLWGAQAAHAADIEFTQETLPNGLQVIYAPMHNAPVVNVRLLYHVGSRDENDQRQGFAHMFEHMMFRGSAHVAPEQHMKLIGIAGGDSNAFTSFDQTTYHETLPSNNLKLALYLEADRMSSFKVNDNIFKIERNVVAEEWRMRYANQPLGPMFGDLLKTAYTTHSYRWTPIGDMDQLRKASSAELQKFFNTYYVPNNACLVIAGEFKPDEARQWVHDYFGWIPRGGEVPRPEQPEPPQTQERVKIVNRPNIPLANIYMGFKTPGYKSDDHLALGVLGTILSSGRTGRLDEALVNLPDAPCVQVGAEDWQSEDPSLFIVSSVVSHGKDPDAVVKAIMNTIDGVIKNGVTQDELDRVRTQARREIILSRQTCDSIATQLGDAAVFEGDPNRANTLLDRLNKLTPADITAVAKKYLVPEHMTVLQYRPGPSEELMQATSTADDLKKAKVVESTQPVKPKEIHFPADYPTTPPFNHTIDAVTFNKGVEADEHGIDVITMTDKRLPLFNASLVLRGGSNSEPLDKAGVAELTAELLRHGSAGKSQYDFASDLESHGISISVDDHDDNTRLNIACTSDQIDYAIARAKEVLAQPNFSPEEFEQAKQQAIGGLMQELSSPPAVASRELAHTLYGNTPLGHRATPASLQAITLQDVKDWYKKVYQTHGAIIIFSGDLTPDRGDALADDLLKGFTQNDTPPTADYPATTQPSKPRVVLIDNPQGRQATVRLATLAYTIRNDDKYAGSVAGQILSAGIESRLNQYVRAEKGLTYGCYAYFRPGRHGGAFSGSVDTKPETAGEAIEAMEKVFNDLRTSNVTKQELLDAQSRVAGGMIMETQTMPQQADRRVEQILNAYPVDYYDQYPAQIAKVTADQVREVMNKYVKPDQMTYVVVAPAKVVADQLKKIGDVTILPMPTQR